MQLWKNKRTLNTHHIKIIASQKCELRAFVHINEQIMYHNFIIGNPLKALSGYENIKLKLCALSAPKVKINDLIFTLMEIS